MSLFFFLEFSEQLEEPSVEEKPFIEEERKIGSENKNVCVP